MYSVARHLPLRSAAPAAAAALLRVRMDTVGTARDLPAEADLAAYRVVQESLTNVLRHGATKVADVRIGYDTDSVTITISNPLPAPPVRDDDRAGLGIPGMRTRVTALAGEFTAGAHRRRQVRDPRRDPGGHAMTSVLIVDDPDLTHTRIVVLTTFELDEYVFDALHHGASGLLLKDTSPAELVQAIHLVAGGSALLAPSVTRRVIREFAPRPARRLRPQPDLGTLTEREREIVGLVGKGLSNDEIAERLVIRPATARTHVSRAMVKLAARDRAQLVVFAYRSGLTA